MTTCTHWPPRHECPECNTFRYDLNTFNGPRVILITEDTGKRSTVPLLGTVVLPSATQR